MSELDDPFSFSPGAAMKLTFADLGKMSTIERMTFVTNFHHHC